MESRVIRAHDGAGERGFRIGKATRQQIQEILVAQDRTDNLEDRGSLRHWLPEAWKLLPYIKDYAPTTLAEMKGMAEGARLPFDDLLLLTCAYEKHVGGSFGEHCTAFAATGSATFHGDLICGQNNDEAVDPWLAGEVDVLLHHLDPSGLQTFIYTHPGIPAYIGMNSFGLCVLWMYIDNGERQLGVPTNALIRELLCQTTLDGALATWNEFRAPFLTTSCWSIQPTASVTSSFPLSSFIPCVIVRRSIMPITFWILAWRKGT